MIYHHLRQRQFINTCIDMLSAHYNQNTIKLRQMINSSYDISDPVSSLLNIHTYLHKPRDINEVNMLVREQIKINRMIVTGKEMLKNDCGCTYKEKVDDK